ncbi:ADP/ATP translocase 1 [Dictyocaulus viviparus]|uniref:ADP/ATP translocase n=1 Tax=Dictyocaulus viviparus TaxID=29172 RepID=A0A0D8XTY7_DICVI|nr:ADP/ATP translocase 1 [Dictyocaulus viviparus]
MSQLFRHSEPSNISKFVIDLSVGGASAAISKTVVAPIERVKLLLQVQYSHKDITAQNRYNGIVDAFLRVPKEQGFLSFWRGNFTNVMRYFPTQALNFAFNDLYKSFMLKDVSYSQNFWKYTFSSLAAGGCAGSTTLCFVYPLDFIRTRLSVDVGTHKANRDYLGFMDCLKKTLNSNGVIGLYRGFSISIQTYFIYRASYFGLYDSIRQSIQKDKKKLNFFGSFIIAQVVSIFSAYLTYPWDTVRRRMMIRGTLSSGRALQAAKRILAEEGVRGLFKGGLANILRSSGGALVMATYEEIQKHL